MSLSTSGNKRLRNESNGSFQEEYKRSHTILNHPSRLGTLYSVCDELHLVVPNNESVVIGRSRGCDLVLKGVDISTRHCEFVRVWNEATSRYYIDLIDLSSNGTFVNGAKVSVKNSLIKDGDRIDFAKSGAYIFKYFDSDMDQCRGRVDKENTDVQSRELGKQRSFFDYYVLGKQLGSGHYALVKEATNKITSESFAVKIFKPHRVDDRKSSKQFNQEMNVLKSIEHENIVRMVDAFIMPVSRSTVETYLVLEKVNDGELFSRIVRKQKLAEAETKAIFKQLLSGLQYLHHMSIVHRDIKPENILLEITRREPGQEIMADSPWDSDELNVHVKIADFGLAKLVGELSFTSTLCGTPAYVAPEVLAHTRQYAREVDLWSAGVVLYVCLAGFPPFSDELGPPSMREQILEARYSFFSPYFDDIDDAALELITGLLQADPSRRLSVDAALGHPWFSAML